MTQSSSHPQYVFSFLKEKGRESKEYFSTSHVIPHIRALVPCPGLTSEVCVVASTSVPLTPTEILNFVFLQGIEYFCRASGT